ncbi:MAG TPA: helix-turn-helix domain-containing protein [Micromonosporaceae bacterium]|nr:helix-turn-helix domain-containing protein [Micromonosporaceae bacterium]
MSSAGAIGPELAALRATAHPTRRAILALLDDHKTLTATECGTLLGVSPKTCSYHLHVLADRHLVEEVPALGRNRPWRHASALASSSASAGTARRSTPDARHSADALNRGDVARLRARSKRDDQLLAAASAAIARATRTPAWSAAVTVHAHLASMTAAEIASWAEDVERLTRRHVRRTADEPDGADGRTPVQLLFVGFPSDL